MFAEWLDERMRILRITNVKLAKEVGVSTGAVWAWRRGDYPPATKHVAALAEAIGVSEFEIYCAVRDMPYEDLSDGRLAAMFGIKPGADTQISLRLTALVVGAVHQWLDELESGERSPGSSQEAAVAARSTPTPSRKKTTRARRADEPASVSQSVSVKGRRPATPPGDATGDGAEAQTKHSPHPSLPAAKRMLG
jgi:transcriptional regulator with XRE-family HTH domain